MAMQTRKRKQIFSLLSYFTRETERKRKNKKRQSTEKYINGAANVRYIHTRSIKKKRKQKEEDNNVLETERS